LDGLPRESNDGDQIILVDADDVPQGVAPKIEVHRRGLKHRALSVLVRDPSGNMLVHRRNAAKYHSGGLWTNACCSHPRPDEPPAVAAHRRLAEEMGVCCKVKPLFTAHYRAVVSNGYIEDEIVHAFGGTYEGPVGPDPAEVAEWKWMPFTALAEDLTRNSTRSGFATISANTTAPSRHGWRPGDWDRGRPARISSTHSITPGAK
jgi:isopentenyl-diphosphate delta-isomerase